MHKVFISILIVFHCATLKAQEDSQKFIFLPDGHQFAPLRANLQEPRIGVLKFLDAGEMKVDIGNAVDVFGYSVDSLTFTAGIDFMAYAYTTGAQGLRLQIDALDGFFGGDISGTLALRDRASIQGRIRILHQSAHMVDGHYLSASNSWIDNRPPIPFTRDFGEVTIAHTLVPSWGTVRFYGGASYASLVRPSSIRRYAFFGGYEIVFRDIAGRIAERASNIFFAHHLALDGNPSYVGTNELQAGVKFGEWFGKGPSIYIEYYSGRHMFSEYFDKRLTTIGLGFTVDFF